MFENNSNAALPKHIIRVAAYGRYSGKNQSAESAKDQIKMIQFAIKDQDVGSVKFPSELFEFQLADEHIFMDEAKSARTTVGRTGYDNFVSCITSGSINVAIVHSLSRLCRDMGDQIDIYNIAQFREVELISLSEGLSTARDGSKQNFIFNGMINEFGNEMHSKQTRRGLCARVLDGYSAGDICYGYDSTPTKTRNRGGLTIPSHYVPSINEEQAKGVRLIFQLRVKGYGYTAIANYMTENRIEGPPRSQKITGKKHNWSASSIRKILTNEKYIGIWDWGKGRKLKNPLTKKFEFRAQSKDKWLRHFDGVKIRDDLVIIDQEIWAAVQKTINKEPKVEKSKGDGWADARASIEVGGKSDILLAGVLSCGYCGANMLQIRSGYLGCYTHFRKGKVGCKNNNNINNSKLEAAVTEQLKEVLLNDHNINMAVKLVNQKIRERMQAVPDELRLLLRQRSSTEKAVANLMRFIKDNGEVSEAVMTELRESEQKLNFIKARQQSLELTKIDKLLMTSFAVKDQMMRLLELFKTDKIMANAILRKMLPERLSCTSLAENNGKNKNQFTSKWKIEGEIIVASANGGAAAVGDDLKPAIKLGFVVK